MKAIIMAGGEGSRLRPLTSTMPKPMTRIMNRPCMEHIIRLLKKHDICEIGVTLAYMPDQIRDYFGDGHELGVSLTYFTEKTPLGTAGSVKNTGDFLTDDFLVISGDAICDMDLTKLIAYHKARRGAVTIALKPMEIPLEYGVVVTDGAGRILRFLEKPSWSRVVSDTINTGIYVLSPSVLNVTEKMPCDFSKDIFPTLLREGVPMYGYVTDKYWCDIGDLDAYRHCHYDVFEGKIALSFPAREVQKGIFLEEGAVIEEGAIVKPPVLLGKNSRVARGAVVEGYTVIGENTIVLSGASIKRSVLYDNVCVGENAEIRGAVLASCSVAESGAALYEQSVLGAHAHVGRNAKILPSVKIWPHKAVQNEETVTENLVWAHCPLPACFGEREIHGRAGVDISPALIRKLGASLTGVLGQNIGVAHDGTAGAKMLSYALFSGVLSTKGRVYDFGQIPLPVLRGGVRAYALGGGVYIGIRRGEAYVDVLNEKGMNVDRNISRKTETLLARADFPLCDIERIKEVEPLYDYKENYIKELMQGTSPSIPLRILVATDCIHGEAILKRIGDAKDTTVRITGGIAKTDLHEMQAFQRRVAIESFDFGAILDEACERITLVDARGRIVKDEQYDALCALLVMEKYKDATIYVGAGAPSVIEDMANVRGNVVERGEESPIARMATLCGEAPPVKMQFALQFDGVSAIFHIADFLAERQVTLSSLLDKIPPFFICRRDVACDFGAKGHVIRALSDFAEKKDMTDGIKIYEKDGWVLILPDAERAVCRVIAQSSREEYAAELTDFYDAKISEIIKKGV